MGQFGSSGNYQNNATSHPPLLTHAKDKVYGCPVLTANTCCRWIGADSAIQRANLGRVENPDVARAEPLNLMRFDAAGGDLLDRLEKPDHRNGKDMPENPFGRLQPKIHLNW
jgi:hypothetical protein